MKRGKIKLLLGYAAYSQRSGIWNIYAWCSETDMHYLIGKSTSSPFPQRFSFVEE